MQFQLRPRQKEFVQKCLTALGQHQNTLGVAPTGSGKTVMGSSVVVELLRQGAGRALIIQHREELVRQNRSTFYDVAGRVTPVGTINANHKEFDRPVTFASVQTLANPRNLDQLPAPDIILTDEAHHGVAPSYLSIYQRFPQAVHLGLTATPNRGDGKTLRPVWDNCADQIPLGDLIRTGVLVYPQTHVIDLNVADQIQALRPDSRSATDYDMDAVAGVLNRPDINQQVVKHWQQLAGDRKTVVFCSNLDHVDDVCRAFEAAGVTVDSVDGSMNMTNRREVLDRFENGDLQVLVNCAVLTEGWDCQLVSCVVLLRASSYLSTLIQMIGRGLRKLNPIAFPNAPPKENCVVLDFGTSLLTHGKLEQEVDLTGDEPSFEKTCPNCLGKVTNRAKQCPLCGYEFAIVAVEREARQALVTEGEFRLSQLTLFEESPFTYEPLWGGRVWITTVFSCWAVAVFYKNEWCAIGGAEDLPARVLYRGDRLKALCECDDWMRANADPNLAAKMTGLRHLPADQSQHRAHKGQLATDANRYQAACLTEFRLNEIAVRQLVTGPDDRVAA